MLIASLYFFLNKRVFDYYTIAFFGCFLYFMPGFFGMTSYLNESGWVKTPIHELTYLLMIIVIFSILMFGWIADKLFKTKVNFKRIFVIEYKVHYSLLFLALVSSLSLILLIISTNGMVFQAEKDSVLESLNRWHILFYSAATLGFPIAAFFRKIKLSIVFFTLLVVNLYIGFRAPIVISVLALLVVFLSAKGPIRLIVYYKWLLTFTCFGLLMFLYKYIAFGIKAGLWDLVFQSITNAETYVNMITMSEPFVVLNNLNIVIIKNYTTGFDHLMSAVYQLILFAPQLGAETVSFNDHFQNDLFPTVKYGLASNIWAQMLSSGGWLLCVFFVAFYNIALFLGRYFLYRFNLLTICITSPIFVYFAFYIHRNDLGYAINISKRLFLIIIAVKIFITMLDSTKKVQNN
ncbi:MAG: hypothetical protein ACI9O6_000645 [Glaciecola sp.]|jgi:hypothetical protein